MASKMKISLAWQMMIGLAVGVIVGATLMGVINLGMSIMGIDMNWQKVVKGLVVLAAVIFDVESKKNSR